MSDTKFEIIRCLDGSILFSGRIDAGDLLVFHEKLADSFDRRQLDDTAETTADHLLDLELIYRKLHQHAHRPLQ